MKKKCITITILFLITVVFISCSNESNKQDNMDFTHNELDEIEPRVTETGSGSTYIAITNELQVWDIFWIYVDPTNEPWSYNRLHLDISSQYGANWPGTYTDNQGMTWREVKAGDPTRGFEAISQQEAIVHNNRTEIITRSLQQDADQRGTFTDNQGMTWREVEARDPTRGFEAISQQEAIVYNNRTEIITRSLQQGADQRGTFTNSRGVTWREVEAGDPTKGYQHVSLQQVIERDDRTEIIEVPLLGADRCALYQDDQLIILVDPGTYDILVEDEDCNIYTLREVEVDEAGLKWNVTLDDIDPI